ncbi:diguanylate cyclase [Tsukamurella ocularis]|uniref:GGDEF domain-containing protein n=1 Tax=Tsukamurella ocularis TaxID=1970234 RepID=UPI0039F0CD96
MSAETETSAAAARRGRRRPSWVRLVRRAWRELSDVGQWRDAGKQEFSYVRMAIGYLRADRALRVAIGLLAMMMFPLALVMQFNPMGPHGVPARIVHMSVAVLGLLLGIRWLVGRWPTVRQATWFLVVSDVLLSVGVGILSDPTARICGTLHLAMMGLYAGFLLGWRILLLHCVYALLFIGGLTGYAILAEGRTLLDLYVYTTPAITTVVGLPVVIQVIVEAGRHGVATITEEWNVDGLTGAYSRRAMRVASHRMASRAGEDALVLVGALDLDGFKQYNDTYGHGAGDQLLQEVTALLKTVPRMVVGRYGGDEFGFLAFRDGPEDAANTVAEVRSLLGERTHPEDMRIPGSVGVVIAPARDRGRLAEFAEIADELLYQAKRSSSDSLIVRDLTTKPG